jgi:hypothetical protein
VDILHELVRDRYDDQRIGGNTYDLLMAFLATV